MTTKINFKSKFDKFHEQWSPKIIAEMNDYQFKLVKIENDFIWHQHHDTDEVFIVIEGKFSIEFENETIEINEGEKLLETDIVENITFRKGTNPLKKRHYRGLDLLENPPIRNLNNSVTME